MAGAEDAIGATIVGRDWLTVDGLAAGVAATVGGKEQRHTRRVKLRPPRVRTMFG